MPIWYICLVLLHLLTSNFLLFQSNTTTASALGNESDHFALLKFKESIPNDPFGVLASWNSSSHFCNWQGVTCGHLHQRVIQLKLEGYRLEGSISPFVGNLSFLRIFSLRSNNFYGQVPQELGRLYRLQVLKLTNNNLVGEFPISLTNFSKVRNLNLADNHLTGQIPMEIGSLGKLERFYLYDNNISGQIPPSISNLSSLIVLSLLYNNLEGNIPKEIGRLKNLANISVAVNKLSGKLPSSLYNLSSLTGLEVTLNQFRGFLPRNMFFTLPNLRIIEMAGNQLSGPVPTSITNASGLQVVVFSRNYFVGQVPNLGNLQNLSFLGLGSNDLGRNLFNDWGFIKSLTNCSKLKEFGIEDNSFEGHLPNFIGNLSTQLKMLIFGRNQIAGQIPTELGNLVNLIALGLEGNHLTGIIPASFGKFQKMQELVMYDNNLLGEMPAIIGNLSQLSQLDLSHNMLRGAIPSTIGNCRSLNSLDISHNNLSGAIPLQILALPSLAILLDLSHNDLRGNLPSEVGMLVNIDTLDVSENHLFGGIPETIGKCIVLEYLYLQGNSFHGIMPSSLASLKGLRHLDLSRNRLFGSIPQELQNISVLEYFNASFNMLEGEVPKNGVFRNASEVSLTNNGNLCGGVSGLRLPPCPLKATQRKKHHNFQMIAVIACSIGVLVLLSCILTIYLLRRRHRKLSTDSTIGELPKVSYRNLHNATNGFSTRNLIGTGSHGSVYKGILDSDEGTVAIKVLNLLKRGAHKSFIAECKAIKNTRHRNLVKILTCCSSIDYNGNDFKALVFEYMSNGSLDEWLHPVKESAEQPRTLSLEKRLEIIIDVASALHYLHYECEKLVIHCDLKPSNVLLDDNMVAHVSDFGLARLLSTIDDNSPSQTSTSGVKGTIGYAPPEYGTSLQVSIEGDIYSFGVLILEMLTGRRPTEELFKDGHNLHNYVQTAFPNNILEIVDATLLSMEEECPIVPVAEENHLSDIVGHLHPNDEKCLLSLLKIGLACSMESPRERVNVMEVNRELNMIRNAFCS